MKVHPKWIQSTPSQPATGPTRTCEWCKRPFDHGTSRRLFCGERDCDLERDRLRKQERAKLTRMLQEADARRAQATQGERA